MENLLGIDVGGTFTDFVLLDSSGKLHIEKVPSTKEAPYSSISKGIDHLGLKLRELSRISYGTTIATNTILERSGAVTGFITTEGFRDVIEMQRWHRQFLYDLHQKRTELFARRALRVTVPERVSADGQLIKEIDEDSVVSAINKLLSMNATSVGVCLINSYANPVNEEKIKEILIDKYPSLHVSISSEISPMIREYERSVVTLINAYVMPRVKTDLEDLENELISHGFEGNFEVAQSNGGLISTNIAVDQPVRLILSGPAGGVMGAKFIGAHSGEPNLITLDMGGTSTDVSLVRNGQPEVNKEEEIEWNVPISLPMVTVKTIGAGGGSIVWIDQGGGLKVGPQSAGADPGPACYGGGGNEPTVTDAQLVLGRLPETGLLGGRMDINKDLATKALKSVAEKIGLSIEETAAGVIRIANEKMIQAIRLITVDRGFDPREFTFLPFGGAGPLHACEMAKEMDIRRILIPPSPGVLSAMGLAVSDVKTNQIASINRGFKDISGEDAIKTLENLKSKAAAILDSHGVLHEKQDFDYSADIRYPSQSYSIEVSSSGLLGGDLKKVAEDFHKDHNKLYHYSMPEEVPFLVNLGVSGTGTRVKPKIKTFELNEEEAKPSQHRKIYFIEEKSFVDAAVFDRNKLQPGMLFHGPAVVEQFDSTTLVPPGFKTYVDKFQNMIIVHGG